MDYLWSPWRFRYVSQGIKAQGCIFCDKAQADPAEDGKSLILFRGRSNFIILNLFPYTTGHVMVAPYAHVRDLADADPATLSEMMGLAQQVQQALKACYHPEGFNIGMNLGRCAGTGVEDHIHLHVVPRWSGDSNFMTVIGETRVEPEDLKSTFDKVAPFFRGK